MTGDLVEFLRARLDEDEAVAKNAPAVMPVNVTDYGARPDDMAFDSAAAFQAAINAAAFGERFSPARVLREVEAKRAIVDAYAAVAQMDTSDPEPEFAYGRAVGLGEAARAIAAVYRDHPGYDGTWRP